MNDLVINKIQSIQRCVARAREEYHSDPERFHTDYTKQDAAILNILRACEQTIDLANYLIKKQKLGIPSSSGESFELLRQKFIIDASLAEKLKKMVHFRNTVIHHYQQTDVSIVEEVIISGLDDLIQFGDRILTFLQGSAPDPQEILPR
jgi:uncharacterized protein YutE (UPF0331/DUF86 family)